MQTVLADQQKATFVLRTRHGICDEATVICFGPFETREQAEKFGVALLGDDNTDGVGSTAKGCTAWDVHELVSPAACVRKLQDALGI